MAGFVLVGPEFNSSQLVTSCQLSFLMLLCLFERSFQTRNKKASSLQIEPCKKITLNKVLSPYHSSCTLVEIAILADAEEVLHSLETAM